MKMVDAWMQYLDIAGVFIVELSLNMCQTYEKHCPFLIGC